MISKGVVKGVGLVVISRGVVKGEGLLVISIQNYDNDTSYEL